MNHGEIAKKLSVLGKKIPREWMKRGIREVDYGKEQREKVERMVNTGLMEKRASKSGFREKVKIPYKTQAMLYKRMERGQFDNKRKETDRSYEKKISEAWDQIIKTKRASGELPSEREARADYERFMASRKR